MSQLLLPPPKPISNQRKNEKSVCSLKMLANKQPKLTKKRLRNFCELESRLGRVDRELEQTHCRRLLGAGRRATPQSSPFLKGGDQGGTQQGALEPSLSPGYPGLLRATEWGHRKGNSTRGWKMLNLSTWGSTGRRSPPATCTHALNRKRLVSKCSLRPHSEGRTSWSHMGQERGKPGRPLIPSPSASFPNVSSHPRSPCPFFQKCEESYEVIPQGFSSQVFSTFSLWSWSLVQHFPKHEVKGGWRTSSETYLERFFSAHFLGLSMLLSIVILQN